MAMPDDVFVMQRHYLSPANRARPSAESGDEPEHSIQFECTEFRWRSSCLANWLVHIPAPTVTLLRRSIKISPPVTDFVDNDLTPAARQK